LKPSEGREALEECQGRVYAIALIHEKLYGAKNFAEVPFSEYLRGLATDVFHVTGTSSSRISLILAVDDVSITVEKAIPCGLIVNELITNALKHAFPAGRTGRIRVELEGAPDGKLRLAVSDDGVGLPEGFDVRKVNSLGLKLVRTLARQLDAELAMSGVAGTRAEIAFAVDP
jgi:two-component sensor histidine kinase